MPSGINNIFFREINWSDFNAMCEIKLGIKAKIHSGYKLCDLKPMYGLLFEDYLRDYEYWGHCDFDMIFGDLDTFLNGNKFNEFDVFCVQEMYASGPFQIFRNTDRVNKLFQQSPTWKNVFDKPTYIGFDEAGDVIRELWAGKNIWECKGEVYSMTHILKNETLLQSLDLKINMKELITEGLDYNDKIYFDSGKLILQSTKEELYIYHFMNRRNKFLFNSFLGNMRITSFEFSSYGFSTGSRLTLIYGLFYSLAKRYIIRVVRKLKS
jgi:hypothetical protein